jgi:hypothetical protein
MCPGEVALGHRFRGGGNAAITSFTSDEEEAVLGLELESDPVNGMSQGKLFNPPWASVFSTEKWREYVLLRRTFRRDQGKQNIRFGELKSSPSPSSLFSTFRCYPG